MTKSDPTRPKRRDITRSKHGCLACRKKRKKCDETKPQCRRCVDTRTACQYNAVLEFRDATDWAAHKVRTSKKQATGRKQIGSSTHGSPSQPAPFSILTPVEGSPHDEEHDIVPEESATMAEHEPSDSSPSQKIGAERTVGRDQSSFPIEHASQTNYLFAPSANQNDPASWLSTDLIDASVPFPVHFGEPADLEGAGLDSMILSPLDEGGNWAAWQQGPPPPLHGSAGIAESHIHQVQTNTLLQNPRTPSSFMDSASETATILEMPELEPVQSNNSQNSGVTLRSGHGSQGSSLWCDEVSAIGVPQPSPSAAMSVSHRQYLAHFQVHIVEAIPGPTDSFRWLMTEVVPIRSAAMAVAAANLANRQGSYRSDSNQTWQPRKSHLDRAAALRSEGLAALMGDSAHLNLGVRLVMMLMMVCYDLEVGNVTDIWLSLKAMEETILARKSEVMSLAYGRDLISTWLHLWALAMFHVRPQAPLMSESPIEMAVADIARQAEHTSHIISLIGTNANRIVQRMLATRCMFDRRGATKSIKNFITWWSIVRGEPPDRDASTFDVKRPDGIPILTADHLFVELAALHDQLDLCDPPEGFPENFDPHEAISLPAEEAVRNPITFEDPREAIECLDYAFAQIMCDESLLRDLLRRQSTAGNQNDAFRSANSASGAATNPWMFLMLRIAAGIDPCETFQHNVYRKGLCTYLMTASIHCNEPVGLDILRSCLKKSSASGMACENLFTPLPIYLACSQVLLRETERGRTILSYSSTTTAPTKRKDLFARKCNDYLMLFGREADGRHFQDVIPYTCPDGGSYDKS